MSYAEKRPTSLKYVTKPEVPARDELKVLKSVDPNVKTLPAYLDIQIGAMYGNSNRVNLPQQKVSDLEDKLKKLGTVSSYEVRQAKILSVGRIRLSLFNGFCYLVKNEEEDVSWL